MTNSPMRYAVAIGGALCLSAMISGLAPAADTVVKPELFSTTGAVKAPQTVDCTLTNGDKAKCYQFVYTSLPDGVPTGPFCPKTVNDKGGLWVWDGDHSGLYILDKAFWKLMKSLGFDFTDADGSVHVRNLGSPPPQPKSSASPDKETNSCLERDADTSVQITAQIPLVPVKLSKPRKLRTIAPIGLALDGVPIFGSAPSVLDTGNLPAVDYCGGHFDPSGYYHWHEVATDVRTMFDNAGLHVHCGLDQAPSGLFGFAYDGFPIYGSLDAGGVVPDDLDECNGHFGATAEYPNGIYHYHARKKAHSVPECLVGATSTHEFHTNAKFGAGAKTGSGNAPHDPRLPHPSGTAAHGGSSPSR